MQKNRNTHEEISPYFFSLIRFSLDQKYTQSYTTYHRDNYDKKYSSEARIRCTFYTHEDMIKKCLIRTFSSKIMSHSKTDCHHEYYPKEEEEYNLCYCFSSHDREASPCTQETESEQYIINHAGYYSINYKKSSTKKAPEGASRRKQITIQL